jgi:hypothetical protein
MKALAKAVTVQKINIVERRPPLVMLLIRVEICNTPPDFSRAVPMMNRAPMVRGASFLKTSKSYLSDTSPKRTVQQRTVSAIRSDGATSFRNAKRVRAINTRVMIIWVETSIAPLF